MENLNINEEQLDLFKEVSEDVSEDTLPPETEEKGCGSFDDLVYVAPKGDCQIFLSSLSDEQESFLQGNLNFDTHFKKVKEYDEDSLYYCGIDRDWIYSKSNSVFLPIFFNDIFIHKDDWVIQ